MNFFKKWLKKREEESFKEGYDFAAGVVLNSQGSFEIIEDLEMRADTPFDYPNQFDKGVLKAVYDFKSLLKARNK